VTVWGWVKKKEKRKERRAHARLDGRYRRGAVVADAGGRGGDECKNKRGEAKICAKVEHLSMRRWRGM